MPRTLVILLSLACAVTVMLFFIFSGNRERTGPTGTAGPIDESKLVDVLGKFPLPVEVIPMARSHVARELVRLGGQPIWREGFITDNGNVILDVHNLQILAPAELETTINQIAGVVTNGLFARRGADTLLLACSDGVHTLNG